MDILIGGVGIVVLIEIIIKLLKAIKRTNSIGEKVPFFSTDWLPHLNVLVGIILLAVAKLWGGLEYTWLETIVVGIITGAGTGGIYEVRKSVGLPF